MADRLTSEDFSLEIEEHGNGCRLSLVMSWEALESLLSTVALRIDPRLAATREEQRRRREMEAKVEAKRAENLKLGCSILAEVDRLKFEGLPANVVWSRVASERGLTAPVARALGRIAKSDYLRGRDREILRLHGKGYSLRQIETCTGVSRSTVADRLKKLIPAPGDGGESRPSSGDRAAKARREGLDAPETPPRSPQGSGSEGSGNAAPSLPVPLPVGETRGCGGKAPARRRARGAGND